MASFDKTKAEKSAVDLIESIEKKKLESFRVILRPKDICNQTTEDDILQDENGSPNGPQSLQHELDVKNHFCCGLCKNIPVTPIAQCKACQKLYCSDQCLKELKEKIEAQKAAAAAAEATEKAASEEKPADDGVAEKAGEG